MHLNKAPCFVIFSDVEIQFCWRRSGLFKGRSQYCSLFRNNNNNNRPKATAQRDHKSYFFLLLFHFCALSIGPRIIKHDFIIIGKNGFSSKFAFYLLSPSLSLSCSFAFFRFELSFFYKKNWMGLNKYRQEETAMTLIFLNGIDFVPFSFAFLFERTQIIFPQWMFEHIERWKGWKLLNWIFV